jgi:hypothetical protein
VTKPLPQSNIEQLLRRISISLEVIAVCAIVGVYIAAWFLTTVLHGDIAATLQTALLLAGGFAVLFVVFWTFFWISSIGLRVIANRLNDGADESPSQVSANKAGVDS